MQIEEALKVYGKTLLNVQFLYPLLRAGTELGVAIHALSYHIVETENGAAIGCF